MTDPYVHELLTELHHELKHADTLSERDRELFDHLATHVQELIEKTVESLSSPATSE